MSLTARQLNRATLGRQLLLGRASLDVVEAVHRVAALQAQEPASPYVALWNRVVDFDPISLDRAFADGGVVRAHLMRIAMHAVDARDYPAFHEAMQGSLRAARLHDRRFKESGVSIAEADALVGELLEYARTRRSGAEIEAWMDERLGARAHPRVWWAIRHYGPLHHAPTGGPWSFGPTKAYVAARERSGDASREAGMAWLVRRYLAAFGPASAQDVASFAMIHAGPVRKALAALLDGGGIVSVQGPGGRELFDAPDGLLPDEDSPAPPRLLGMWDNVLLAYEDRGRVIPPEHRKAVTRMNGDVLPTLLVDGYVAGVWRPVDGGIEAVAFERIADDAWEGLAAEARALIAFLADRDPAVYRRYGHWWAKLPRGEVRVLAG